MATFSDNFNRADGGLGSDWSSVSGFGTFQISSNIVRHNTPGFCAQTVNTGTATFTADQEASATITAVFEFDRIGPAVRVSASGGYAIVVNGTTGTAYISPFTPSARPSIGSGFSVAVGDVVRIRVVDDQVTAYVNDVLADTVTDPTYTTGQPGLWGDWENSRGTQLDNFFAADVAALAPAAATLAHLLNN